MKRSPLLAAIGLAAGIAALTAQLGHAEGDPNVKPTITSGKQVALMADIAGSLFRDVNLAGAEFENTLSGGPRMRRSTGSFYGREPTSGWSRMPRASCKAKSSPAFGSTLRL